MLVVASGYDSVYLQVKLTLVPSKTVKLPAMVTSVGAK